MLEPEFIVAEQSVGVSFERPDLWQRSAFQPLLRQVGHAVIGSAVEALCSDYQPNLAVLVRTKNDQKNLENILGYISRTREHYKGRIDTIVVDTESEDNTKEIARNFGAVLIDIYQSNFSYPHSLNVGLAEVKDDIEATYLTVGHALPAVSNALQAGVRHFEDEKVSGVSAYAAMYDNASVWEKLILGNGIVQRGPARAREKAVPAVMCNFSAMIRMETWQKHPFDENFAGGAEDLEWVRGAFARGETIMYEPGLTAHHTHGSNFKHFLRELRNWKRIAEGPLPFNQADLESFRPDLFGKK
jgi:glycosyltransferase involved in cell wall biosynthesis